MSVLALLKCVQRIRLVKTRLEALCVCVKKASSLAPWTTQSLAEVKELLVRSSRSVLVTLKCEAHYNERWKRSHMHGCAYILDTQRSTNLNTQPEKVQK